MSKLIELPRGGFDQLSDEEKLYLAQRGKLPPQHIDDELASQLDLSGRASTVAYGAHTGSIRTMTDEELEAELKRRRSEYVEDPRDLMPDLENPNSERLDEINANREETDATAHERVRAAQRAAEGPSYPTLGHPQGVGSKSSAAEETSDDEDEDWEHQREDSVEAYAEWSKDDLVLEADNLGLDVGGTKREIAARIVAWDDENPEESSDDDE